MANDNNAPPPSLSLDPGLTRAADPVDDDELTEDELHDLYLARAEDAWEARNS